jgi:signal transduction histidine kinase
MIELDKLSKQNRNFGFKLFFSYLTFTALILVAITVIHIYFSDEQKVHKFEREASLQADEKKHQFDSYFKKREDALLALSKNEYFVKFVENRSYKYYIDLLFLTIMESNKEYMQMRFIGKDGFEKLRFDRDKHSLEPYKSNILQDKSNRYYFKASSVLNSNRVWFSEMDLNIEHGSIEKPFKPVVRLATPIYINRQFQGILIINLFMEELLENLTKSSIYDIYLIDEGGYYIKHKNPKYNWSLYDSKHSIDSDFEDDVVYNIQSSYKNKAVFGNNIYVQSLFLDNQKINMIFVEKDTSIQQMNDNNNKMVITILIFALFFSVLFSFLLSRPLNHMYEIVLKQGDRLHDLATNLDRKVALESLRNAKKDRLLQHQSKLAELGDMIGNIAHQWRHPLTRLSLTLQNLKAFKNKGKMSDEMLDDALENSLYQIEFMSNTIDNFKNFYRKDLEKSDFKVKDVIDNVLNIIGSVLEHDNITLTIIDEEHQEIFGNKNEFSQVLMNLMINAKDALVEQNIKDPMIRITISSEDDQTKIEVEDNAGGISNGIIDDIFNPYFTTKDEKGTGIGLYLAKAIIEDKMKGSIEAKNINEGALFTILV